MLGGILILALTAVVEVDLAPDQPLHFVYVDDPLIVELRSDTSLETNVRLSAHHTDRDATVTAASGPLHLPAHGVYWWALQDLPGEKGYYAVDIRFETPDGPVDAQQHFCRVERPGATAPLPAWAQSGAVDKHELLALKSIGVGLLRLEASNPDAEAQAAAAAAQGLGIIVAVDAQAVSDAAALAARFPAAPARWDVRAPGAERFAAFADALRKAGVTAPIAAVATPDADLAALLQPPVVTHARELVIEGGALSWEQVAAIQYVARRTGQERWRLHAASLGEDALPLAQELAARLAAGFTSLGFNTGRVYNGRPGQDFAALSGINGVLDAHDPAGPLSLPEGITGNVFRNCERWCIVLHANKESAKVRVPVGAAQGLRLFDVYHNELPPPEVKEGAVAVTLSPQPAYLCGTGGTVLNAAARNQAVRQARIFAAQQALREQLPPLLMQRIGEIAAAKTEGLGRANFLFLLRAFPFLEEAWQQGGLPKEAAAPALGGLADLLRSLCVLQEDIGESFATPLANRLEKCEEYRALYLTGTEARERGDWLLEEVLRLMNEAEALDDAGRHIEANAVGAIAEWRARTLDFAAKAPPLVEPTEEHLLEVPPAAEPSGAPETTPEGAAPAPEAQTPAAPEPPAPPEPAPGEPSKLTHTVARGDNPSTIAHKYGVAIDDLLKWNNLSRRSTLHIGDELIVYVQGAPPAEEADAPETPAPAPEAQTPAAQTQADVPPDTEKVTHTVRRGDNPSIIADKYGVSLDDFLKWNGLTRRATLHIGDEYVVYVKKKPG
ncbi:MAG: LysM peptidoglycan-binding domain-containing protein [Candidatus Hydrogenedentes bacterium]|nr:LysM peptidoglycan-binding domain-containing protein [Candidatus Hydrogenedentota bacterium]